MSSTNAITPKHSDQGEETPNLKIRPQKIDTNFNATPEKKMKKKVSMA